MKAPRSKLTWGKATRTIRCKTLILYVDYFENSAFTVTLAPFFRVVSYQIRDDSMRESGFIHLKDAVIHYRSGGNNNQPEGVLPRKKEDPQGVEMWGLEFRNKTVGWMELA